MKKRLMETETRGMTAKGEQWRRGIKEVKGNTVNNIMISLQGVRQLLDSVG